jgi:protein tyrosine phosphatase (PTP) superfamily phosphohydrolase (DUF442 family)
VAREDRGVAEALHLRRVSPTVLCGAAPTGPAHFRLLQQLGVRTIVSVDGAAPNVTEARRRGLRTVHIPIGYDGVPAHGVAALTRVMRELELPVFVHCHYGRHRGPAAAALCGMIAGELDLPSAIDLLQSAGTNPDYAGLWESVRAYRPLPEGATLPELPESADVPYLVEAMVRIEHLCGAVDKPGSIDRRTAVLLHEEIRECTRLLPAASPAGLREAFAAAEADAQRLVALTGSADSSGRDSAAVRAAFAEVQPSCGACHRRFRD